MMHTLGNRKLGRKRAQRRFTGDRHRLQTAVSPHLAGAIRDQNASFQTFVGFKAQSVMHTFVSTWGSGPRISVDLSFHHICATSDCPPSKMDDPTLRVTACLLSRCTRRPQMPELWSERLN